MTAIGKSHDTNLGGLAKLFVAATQDVKTGLDLPLVPGLSAHTISQAFIDANFDEIGFLHRSANHDAVPAGAGLYGHSVVARIPKERTEVKTHQQAYRNKKATLLYQMNNGDWGLLTDMVLMSDFRSGKEPSNGNGYTFSWKATLPYEGIEVVIS